MMPKCELEVLVREGGWMEWLGVEWEVRIGLAEGGSLRAGGQATS